MSENICKSGIPAVNGDINYWPNAFKFGERLVASASELAEKDCGGQESFYFQELIRSAETIPFRTTRNWIWREFSSSATDAGLRRKNPLLFEQAIGVAERLKGLDRLIAFRQIAASLSQMDLGDRAAVVLDRFFAAAQTLDKPYRAEILGSIASLSSKAGLQRRSDALFKISLALIDEMGGLGDVWGEKRALVIGSLARCLSESGLGEKKKIFFDRLIVMAENIMDEENRFMALRNIAYFLEKSDLKEEASVVFRKLPAADALTDGKSDPSPDPEDWPSLKQFLRFLF